MAEQTAVFSESAARRVAKATRYVERMSRNGSGQRRRNVTPGKVSAGGSFYTAGFATLAANTPITSLTTTWQEIHSPIVGCEAINGPTFWGVQFNYPGVWEFICQCHVNKTVGTQGEALTIGSRLDATALLFSGTT